MKNIFQKNFKIYRGIGTIPKGVLKGKSFAETYLSCKGPFVWTGKLNLVLGTKSFGPKNCKSGFFCPFSNGFSTFSGLVGGSEGLWKLKIDWRVGWDSSFSKDPKMLAKDGNFSRLTSGGLSDSGSDLVLCEFWPFSPNNASPNKEFRRLILALMRKCWNF